MAGRIFISFILLLLMASTSFAGAFMESDPQVGTVTENKWCMGKAGSVLDCDQNTPSGSIITSHMSVTLASTYGCTSGWQAGALASEVADLVAAGINANYILCIDVGGGENITPTGLAMAISLGIPSVAVAGGPITLSPSGLAMAIALGTPTIDVSSGAVSVSDNFNRTDENPLGNGNWTAMYGKNPLKIVSNAARGSVVSVMNGSYWSADTFSSDQCSKATLITGFANHGVAVRVQTDAATYYYMQPQSSTVMRIYKNVAGTLTKLGADISGTFANNDVYEICAVGTTITPYQNGTAISGGARTDSAIASGYPGLLINSNTASYIFDNWEGRDAP